MPTHILPRGVSIAPMPKLRDGEVGRKVQGGLPPEPYRSTSHKWIRGAKFAREPYQSRAIKFEVFHTTSEWDSTARKGLGAWVLP